MSTETSSFATRSEDLLIEVLLRLPVKSLLKMKSVCKAWYTLINSSYFLHMHANLAIQDHLIILDSHVLSFRSNDNKSFSTRECKPDLVLPPYGNLDYLIIGSCNGIVCFSDVFSIIFLCNPATRKFKQLPPTSFRRGKGLRFYNDCKPGFGFDSSNINDLKVISIRTAARQGVQGSIILAEAFSLSSNSWRQLDWVGEHMDISLTLETKFCANSCHWNIKYHNEDSILCFDMHTESFKTLNFPNYNFGYLKNVMVFKEYLSVISYASYEFVEEQCIDIWIMKEYGVEDSWTKLCSTGPLSSFLYPLTFWMNDHALLLRHDNDKVVSCNLNNRDVEFLRFNRRMEYLCVAVHKETLFSIK